MESGAFSDRETIESLKPIVFLMGKQKLTKKSNMKTIKRICCELAFTTRFSGSQYGRSPPIPIQWNCNTMCLRPIVGIIHPNDSFVDKNN